MIQPKIQEVHIQRNKEYLAYLNTLERNEDGGIISYLPKDEWVLRNHIIFTPEEFEQFKREFGKELLELAADKATTREDFSEYSDFGFLRNVPNGIEVNKESITSVLDDYLLNNKI
jgi:hypothetical protein